jgi:outer membrane protein OmpA-like peptidoglycan-associated protein
MRTSFLIPVAAFILLQSVGAHAAGIYQMGYRYAFGDMAGDGAHGRTFVICGDECTAAPPLTPAPRFPALSIRVSRDIAAKNSPEKAPDVGSRDTPPNSDMSGRGRAAGTHITVLFGLDSPVLSDAERVRLSSFVNSLGAEPKDSNLFVTGYTCDLGGKAHNDVLAAKRAEAVEAYLRRIGAHATWVTGMGKCCYVTKDRSKRYLNRRVEVTFSEREGTK